MSRRARKRQAAEDAKWIGLQPEPDDSTERIEELLRQAEQERKEGEEE